MVWRWQRNAFRTTLALVVIPAHRLFVRKLVRAPIFAPQTRIVVVEGVSGVEATYIFCPFVDQIALVLIIVVVEGDTPGLAAAQSLTLVDGFPRKVL